ncbi:STAS domain-containing protein [Streptomyces sp. NPDC057616]|uniref:STAS domain-containing protein n=1 Tax=Streptomyces sp. NPDC057616 TaxID=3346183 RepID=UPI0036A5F0C9
MRLAVEYAEIDGVRVVTAQGEIDHDVSAILDEALLPHGHPTPPQVVVDLSGVTFMDSSGINSLVTAYRAVSKVDGWLRIAGPKDSVQRVLSLVGVDRLVSCHATLEQALHA